MAMKRDTLGILLWDHKATAGRLAGHRHHGPTRNLNQNADKLWQKFHLKPSFNYPYITESKLGTTWSQLYTRSPTSKATFMKKRAIGVLNLLTELAGDNSSEMSKRHGKKFRNSNVESVSHNGIFKNLVNKESRVDSDASTTMASRKKSGIWKRNGAERRNIFFLDRSVRPLGFWITRHVRIGVFLISLEVSGPHGSAFACQELLLPSVCSVIMESAKWALHGRLRVPRVAFV
jgi:hypothetical protein